MNPVLIKPSGERHSQLIVMGRPFADADAGSYQGLKEQLRPITMDALAEERIRRRVLDGAEADLSEFPSLPAKEFVAVAGLINEAKWRKTSFHQNYHEAKNRLQDWMAA